MENYKNQEDERYNNNTTFDSQLKNLIESEKLRWFPWVGSEYGKNNTRILIIGESHYAPEKNYNEEMEYKEKTRETIGQLLCREWTTNFFKNIPKIFFGDIETGIITDVFLWHNVAFYNLIQKPMKISETNIERPSDEDFSKSLKVFEEVVKILNPTHCIFMGVTASYHFFEIFGKKVEWSDKCIGNTWCRKPLTMFQNNTNIIFVKHPSVSKLKEWHEFLINTKETENLINEFKNKMISWQNFVKTSWQDTLLEFTDDTIKIENYIFQKGGKRKDFPGPPRIYFSISTTDNKKNVEKENYKNINNYEFTIEYGPGGKENDKKDFSDGYEFYYGLRLKNKDESNNGKIYCGKFSSNEWNDWKYPTNWWLCWKYIDPKMLFYFLKNDKSKIKNCVEEMINDVAQLLKKLNIK
jgi:hypothetical protein